MLVICMGMFFVELVGRFDKPIDDSLRNCLRSAGRGERRRGRGSREGGSKEQRQASGKAATELRTKLGAEWHFALLSLIISMRQQDEEGEGERGMRHYALLRFLQRFFASLLWQLSAFHLAWQP